MGAVKAGAPKRRGWRAKVLACVVSLLVTAGLGELGLRAFGFSAPSFYRPDLELGVSLRPGASGWYRSEGSSYVTINSHGMRDVEHTAAKPAGTVRIAVLGDSFAEALQVPRERTFWALLQDDLTRRRGDGRRVEVLNFGVSGYGTAQELIQLRQRVWAFAPDVVLLAFFPGNDLRDNAKPLGQGHRPYFTLKDGRLALDVSFREAAGFRRQETDPGWYDRLVDDLRTVQLVKAVRNRVQARGRQARADQALQDGQFEPGLDEEVFREPATPVWTEAWAVTERLLGEMRDEAQGHGAALGVMVVSQGLQVHPDAAVRRDAMQRFGVSDLFYAERRLQRVLGDLCVPTLCLAPAMQRVAEERQVHLHGFAATGNLGRGHWNEAGHRVAAELLGEWLADEPGLLK